MSISMKNRSIITFIFMASFFTFIVVWLISKQRAKFSKLLNTNKSTLLETTTNNLSSTNFVISTELSSKSERNFSLHAQANFANLQRPETKKLSLHEQRNRYKKNHEKLFHNKADFAAMGKLLSGTSLCNSKYPVLIGGVNRGQFTTEFLKNCPRAQINGFEIQPDMFEASKLLFANNPNVKIHNIGWGERLQSGLPISGKDGHAGIFTTIGTGRKSMKRQTNLANVTSVADWCIERGIDLSSYVAIDVEGFEPKVLRGMRLDETQNQARFPHFQFELGGTWARKDPRHGHELEWSQYDAASYLEKNGFKLFLIGQDEWMQVDPYFFKMSDHALDEGYGRFIQGNLLALHSTFSFPDVLHRVLS